MVDASHPYPVRWIDRWLLRDGRAVTVRPVLPQDQYIGQAFVAQGLTAQSRYQRFQTGLRELPATVARYLTDIDYEQHFALVAETFDRGEHLQVAEARFVRDAGAGNRAEFALAVADHWQGQGLGKRMLATLAEAASAQGIVSLYGDVLRYNLPMLALVRGAGFRSATHPEDARLLRVTGSSRYGPGSTVMPALPATTLSAAADR